MSKDLQKSNPKLPLKNAKGKLDLSEINMDALTAGLSELSIPRLFYQLVIFIIDGSNSMNKKTKNGQAKAVEIDKGIRSIIERLKSSKNNSSFDICLLSFSEKFEDVFSIANVKDIQNEQSFNSLNFVEPKGSKLYDCLVYAKEVSEDYSSRNSGKNCQVLIQILSDGEVDDYNESLEVIQAIKEIRNTTIACQFLESFIAEGQNWYSYEESTGLIDYNSPWSIEEVRVKEKKIAKKFKKFASSEAFFKTSIDPEEIRRHMIKSISTISKID